MVLSARPGKLALFPDAAVIGSVRVDMVVPLGPTSIYDLEMPGGQRIKLAERRIGAPTVDVGAICTDCAPRRGPPCSSVTSEAARE